MDTFKYKVNTFDNGEYGQIEVEARRTATPGLLITDCTEVPGMFCITHEMSGLRIASGPYAATDDLDALAVLARQLGACGDWKQEVADILETFGGCAKNVVVSAPIRWHAMSYSKVHEDASAARRRRLH